MLARVGADELDDWQTSYRISPWGERRDELHAGVICSTILNGLRAIAGSTQGDPSQPSDFLLEFGPPKEEVTDPEVMKDRMRSFAMMHGGRG
jgi:hypothetical protein